MYNCIYTLFAYLYWICVYEYMYSRYLYRTIFLSVLKRFLQIIFFKSYPRPDALSYALPNDCYFSVYVYQDIYHSTHDPCEVSGVERMSDPLMNFYATSSIELHHHREVSAISASVSLEALTEDGRSSPLIRAHHHHHKTQANAITTDNRRTFTQPLPPINSTLDTATSLGQVGNRNAFVYNDTDILPNSSNDGNISQLPRTSRQTIIRIKRDSSYTLDSILNSEADGCDGHSVVADSGFNSVRTRSSAGAGSRNGHTIAKSSSTASSAHGVASTSLVTSTTRAVDSALTSASTSIAARPIVSSPAVKFKSTSHNRSTSDVGVSSIRTGLGPHHLTGGRLEEESTMSSSLPTSTLSGMLRSLYIIFVWLSNISSIIFLLIMIALAWILLCLAWILLCLSWILLCFAFSHFSRLFYWFT